MPVITARRTVARAALFRRGCRTGGPHHDPHERGLRSACHLVGGAGTCGGGDAPTGESKARKWILVADDDPGVRKYLTTVLEAAGYVVVVARDGSEARDLIRDLRPHLVILDLRMPHMSGGELLPLIEETPVLVLSGYLGDLSPENAARANVVGRLQKPVDPATLRARVGEALRGYNP
jgi:CheY-like chemotaxis protein